MCLTFFIAVYITKFHNVVISNHETLFVRLVEVLHILNCPLTRQLSSSLLEIYHISIAEHCYRINCLLLSGDPHIQQYGVCVLNVGNCL